MKLIDLLESTPSNSLECWPKVFRNISAGDGAWNSFVRYNTNFTFEVSRDGNYWDTTKGYWMFLPQHDWEVYVPEPVKLQWSLDEAIRSLYGHNAVLSVSHDLVRTGLLKYSLLFIRTCGNGVADCVHFGYSSFTTSPKDELLKNVVSVIRHKYEAKTGQKYYENPTNIAEYKKALGILL